MTALDHLTLGFRPRLPVTLQTEAAECGLACLAMVAGFFGHRVDLGALRRRFSISLKGATLGSLIDIAAQLELASRPLRLEIADLGRLNRPCILHWDFNHFVVLKSIHRRSVVIHDPARGARTVSRRELSARFTGVALELWPQPGFAQRDERVPVTLRQLTGPIVGLYRSLGQILLLAVILELFTILNPQFLQWVIDRALLTANGDLLTTLAVGFALLVVLQQGVRTLRAWVILHIGSKLSLQWSNNVVDHLLRLPLSYFEKRHLGDTLSRIRSIDVIRNGVTNSLVETVVDGLLATTVLVLLLAYSPKLTLVPVVAVVLYLTVRWTSFRAIRQASEETIVHGSRQESHFLETVRGIRAVKLFQGREDRRCGWLGLLADQINADLRGEKLRIANRIANGTIFGLENVVTVWMGASLVLDGAFTVGMLMAFMAYKNQFSARLGALIDQAIQLRMLRLHGERLADIVLTEAEPHGAAARPALPRRAAPARAAGVEIRNLRFRYADREPLVLDGVDLRVAPGESVCLMGASGCGKSTLLHLLLGIVRPASGEIRIGGVALDSKTVDSLRARMAAVLQHDGLFAGTITDNICFFDGRPDQRRIESCARLACVHDDVAAMPMGYDTLVGDSGSVFSGGQQQRILLARALYKRPDILLLDEATSHLDVATETRVNAAIGALNMTRIVVAHRPSTAASSDRVIELGRGRVLGVRQPAGQGGPGASRPDGRAAWAGAGTDALGTYACADDDVAARLLASTGC